VRETSAAGVTGQQRQNGSADVVPAAGCLGWVPPSGSSGARADDRQCRCAEEHRMSHTSLRAVSTSARLWACLGVCASLV